MAMLSPQYATLIFVIIVWSNGAKTQESEGQDDSSTSCVIPPGKYDNYPGDSFNEEPTSGPLCKANSEPVQRIVFKCMPCWCCPAGPCACSTANITRSRRDIPCTNIQCYTQANIWTNYKYVCCPGYNQVNKECVPNDVCLDNYLGCAYSCNTSNGVSSCTCPLGFSLNSQDNRTCQDINECTSSVALCQDHCTNTDGSYVCSCSEGRVLTSDGHTCIASIVPSTEAMLTEPMYYLDRQAPTSGSSFPFQYIIAVVAGSVLFLSLLFLVLFCVCRPHKKPPVEVFIISKNVEADKNADFDSCDKIILSSYDEKKLEDDYASLKGWKDIPLNDDPKKSDDLLAVKGMRAQQNVYSELSIRIPAAPPKRLPAVKPSDLYSDYAEII